jgi:DNA-binding CsgD family transcriptional regulator
MGEQVNDLSVTDATSVHVDTDLPMLAAADPAARVTVESSGLCIVSLDSKLRVREVSAGFLHQFEKTPDEVYGCEFGEFLHPRVRRLIERQLGWLSAGRCDRSSMRFMGVRATGAMFSGVLIGIALRSGDGIGTVMVWVKPDMIRAGPTSSPQRKNMLSTLDAQVLEGVAAGLSTLQLADLLYLSRQGVEYHVGAMLRRFKVPNRAALASKAYAQGILNIGQWPPRVSPAYIRLIWITNHLPRPAGRGEESGRKLAFEWPHRRRSSRSAGLEGRAGSVFAGRTKVHNRTSP